MVLGQYNLVLLGIKWYWASMRLLCLYLLKKRKIWSDVTIAGQRQQTNEQGKIELLSQWTMDGSDEMSYNKEGEGEEGGKYMEKENIFR